MPFKLALEMPEFVKYGFFIDLFRFEKYSKMRIIQKK